MYDHQSREAKAHQGVLCCFTTLSLCRLASTQHTKRIAWMIHMIRYSVQVFLSLLIMTEIWGSLDSMVRGTRQLLQTPAQNPTELCRRIWKPNRSNYHQTSNAW